MKFFIFFASVTSIVFSLNTYNLNLDSSSLEWIGRKIGGEHNGTINFSSGYVALDAKTIKSGAFIVDMSTIKDLDIENMKYRKYLEDHLNNEDFFDTKVHPFAKLTILEQLEPDSASKSLGYNSIISCVLTIKGITDSISIPANVIILNNHATANGSIDIDRTLYDIKYKSKSFFPDIGDKFIYDDFTLNFSIQVDRQWKN